MSGSYRAVTSQADWPSYNGADHAAAATARSRRSPRATSRRWRRSGSSACRNTSRLQVTPVVVRRRDVRDERQRVLRARRRQRPRDLALPAAAHQGPDRQRRRRRQSRRRRSPAIALFMVTDHAHLIALNRSTGALLWETEMADWRQNYNATGAPLPVGNLVVTGTSGGDEGVRGFVAAFDQATGKEVWRFWTVPTAAASRDRRRGRARASIIPGGTTWMTGTYDPELDTVYWPVGNPGPDLIGDDRARRQPLHRFDRRARREDRRAEVALPVHAARRVGLRRAGDAGARRRDVAGPAAQAAGAGQPQRLLLRARSHQRRSSCSARST